MNTRIKLRAGVGPSEAKAGEPRAVAAGNGRGPLIDLASSLEYPQPAFYSGYTRIFLLAIAYSGVIVFAQWLAYLIRFEFHPPPDEQTLFWQTLQWSVPVKLVCLFVFGQFRSLLTYFSLPDARRIVLACGSAGIVSIGVWYFSHGRYAPPRSIIVLGFLLTTSGLIALRIGFRMFRERQGGGGNGRKAARRVLIIGAGDVGANLAREMTNRRELGMRPVAFLDDDRAKWKMRIHGVPVLGQPELLAEKKIRVDEAVFAMPSASGRRIREVVQILNDAHICFETVPSIQQMMDGAVRVSQVRPVEIEDLLGREPVSLRMEKIDALITGKIVMVTGAGGSIGSELCRQIAAHHPLRLLLIERCEVQMFQIEQELLGRGCGSEIIPLVADVLDCERMRGIFRRFRPEVVFHAAAHKHVPMMESQPYEAFRNNTIGTKQMAKLSVEFGVERFLLISTDKAINPTNAMGATKRLAELYLQALQKEIRLRGLGTAMSEDRGTGDCGPPVRGHETANGTGNRTVKPTGNGIPTEGSEHSVSSPPRTAATKLMAVRFGNVLGSSGSVIPTFARQIAAGGPVTVTHPDVTRYFMTIPEAVGLVLQSATQGEGGEIFVLDMGKLVRIVDVARQMIELSGLKPDSDIEITFTGLRPGEKLFEEINHKTENMVATAHPKIMRFVGEPLPFETLRQGLLDIHEKATTLDANQVKMEFQKLVPEYKPYLTTV